MTYTWKRSLIVDVIWPLIGRALAAMLTAIVSRNDSAVRSWRTVSERMVDPSGSLTPLPSRERRRWIGRTVSPGGSGAARAGTSSTLVAGSPAGPFGGPSAVAPPMSSALAQPLATPVDERDHQGGDADPQPDAAAEQT